VEGQRRHAVGAAVIGTAAVGAYAVWAGVQILLLNPLAAVPGKTIEQIRAETTALGQPLGEPSTIVTLSLGVAMAVTALVFMLRSRAMTTTIVIAVYLGLLTVGAFGYFIASFGPGMSLADAYLISGGDYSPWGLPLYVISLGALVALCVLALVLIVRSSVARSRA
jgi:hypothetical protein